MSLFASFPGIARCAHPRTATTITAPARARGQGSALTRELHMPTWAKVALYVLLFGTLQLMLVQLAFIAVPMLWGWQWHNLGCDSKSFSMCAPGGVMPLSQYWVAKANQYKSGDIVSFDYQGSADPSENGPTIKSVDAEAPGWVHVHGLNKANTMAPLWVEVAKVDGKIVAGPISLLPGWYWRWATMGWTLEYEAVQKRKRHLANWKTLFSGTYRKLALMDPGTTTWSNGLRYCMVKEPRSAVVVAVSSGYAKHLAGWQPECWIGCDAVLIRQIGEWSWEYAKYSPTTDVLVVNVDKQGNTRLSEKGLVLHLPGAVVHGPLVYLFDQDKSTVWLVDATSPRTNVSTIEFSRPYTGRFEVVNGGGDADYQTELMVDGQAVWFGAGNWVGQPKPVVELTRAKTITITIEKGFKSPQTSSGISSVTFSPPITRKGN